MTHLRPPSLQASAPVDPLDKGIGPLSHPVEAFQPRTSGWNLLREDISLPAAVLAESALLHNLRWMQQFIEAYGLQLAPHGKTTMTPKLFQMQLQHGAWGITVATAQQAQVAAACGVPRILMANQLVGRRNMELISDLLREPSLEFFCLVDSAAQAAQLADFFSATGQRLPVLIELGVPGGRAGVRDYTQLAELLHTLERSQHALCLAGVEVYEGVLDTEEQVVHLLQRALQLLQSLLAEDRLGRSPALLTGAGSAWYDVVAAVFSAARLGPRFEVVLRPGCYLTHDVGIYREAQARILARNPIARQMQSGLVPALQLWAYVQSMPEPGRAIVGLGKRDAAFDAGLPVPALHYRPGAPAPTPSPSHWRLTRMMDQHAYLDHSAPIDHSAAGLPAQDLRIGDMIAFDISHPCLTFDKWRSLLLVNAHYDVLDVLRTCF